MKMRLFLLPVLSCLMLVNYGQDINKTDSKGRKQGKWVKYHEGSKQKRYVGTFKDDKPIGRFTYYYTTGEASAVTTFHNGGEVAYTKMYHPNGNLMATGKYLDQKKDSTWWYFNDKKEVLSKDQYLNGDLHGTCVVYYPADPQKKEIKKYEVTRYKNGVKEGSWKQYYTSGKLKAEGNYKDGYFDGRIKWYFSSGRVEIEGFYKHTVKNGFWKFYENDGTLKKKIYYKEGKVLEGEKLEKHLEQVKKNKG